MPAFYFSPSPVSALASLLRGLGGLPRCSSSREGQVPSGSGRLRYTCHRCVGNSIRVPDIVRLQRTITTGVLRCGCSLCSSTISVSQHHSYSQVAQQSGTASRLFLCRIILVFLTISPFDSPQTTGYSRRTRIWAQES